MATYRHMHVLGSDLTYILFEHVYKLTLKTKHCLIKIELANIHQNIGHSLHVHTFLYRMTLGTDGNEMAVYSGIY
jgi:hypothetical protein